MPAGFEGYKKAEVTLGGVVIDNILSRSFESQIWPGLCFIGEMLDVPGHPGGFNWQWAWALEHCAGLHTQDQPDMTTDWPETYTGLLNSTDRKETEGFLMKP